MTSEAQYSYWTGNAAGLVKQMTSFVNNDNTKKIVEDYQYDLYGNNTQKVVTATGLQPRTIKYEFSPLYNGRFLTKSTDIENLSTEFTYNATSGVLLSEKSPYSSLATPMINTFSYDTWFKKINETFYDGKIITYGYAVSGSDYTFSQTGNDGSESKSISDFRGRTYKKGYKNINGIWTYQQTEFDDINRRIKEYEPFFTSLGLFNVVKYDAYGRVYQTISTTNKITNITYTGLTTLVDDGIKAVTTIKNATGTVASVTSPDGTITYDYFANDNLKKTSNYGIETIIEQDEWGRKKTLIDPSAGTYTYSYNLLGETTSETTPNGTTTYTIVNGKLTAKTIVENPTTRTNSNTVYTYDNITKLLTSSTFTNLLENRAVTTNTFEYDTYKRLYKTIEVTPFATFSKQFSFDSFGRVNTETSSATIGTKTSAKTIKNTYQNGFPWKMLDNTNQNMLWQTDTVNAKGLLLTASLGNGINISNTFDQYGFATQFKHDKTGTNPANVMTLNTVFDPQKGNLNSRNNSMFGTTDIFTYDSLDRLTNYPNALGVQETQAYDNQGRITKNNLGDYNYSNNDKAYQNTSVTLSPQASGYYNNREGLFNDSMESQTGWDNTGLDPWAVANQATISYDAIAPHSGKYALKLGNTTRTEKVIHTNKEILIDNAIDTYYTYSAWVKSFNSSVDLFLFMKTQTETGYYTSVNSVSTTAINQWVKIEKTVLVPANIKRLSLRLDINGFGDVWFDDIVIRKTSDAPINIRQLNITYNAFKSPVEIVETDVDNVSFIYNDDNGRSTMFYGGLGLKETRQYRKHYSVDGSMEIKQNMFTGAVEFVTYIGGDGYTAPIILKSDGTTQNYFYLHRDYLGSILAITNTLGAVVEKRLFDAWGNIVKVQDGKGNNLNGLTFLDRGYTGHEHLQSIGLIHMNGRLYDPILHRFLQPDNNIQDPYNIQNYNRYGYVLNNPLKYIDPSGEAGEYPGNGGDCLNCGLSNTQQQGAGGLIASIVNFFRNPENAAWAARNFAEAGRFIGRNAQSVGKFFDRNLKSVGHWIGGWFKHSKSQAAPPPIPQFQMNGPSPNVGNIGTNNYFGGGKATTSGAQGGGGMTFPSFSKLWNNYPQDVNGSHAHPSVDPYPNQCAIRVSDAFMKSGIDMSSCPKVNKTSDGYARSSKGLADWTWQNFGKPKIMSQDAFERDYKNSKGLMYIAPPPGGVGHIDLYNAGTTGSGYYLGSKIWFWPIK